MAEIKEVVVSRSCRMNTGNYEGTEYFISIKAEVGEFDTAEEVTQDLESKVNSAMLAQLGRGYAARRKKVSPEDIAKQHGIPQG